MHTLLIETETTCIVGKHLQAYFIFDINQLSHKLVFLLFLRSHTLYRLLLYFSRHVHIVQIL